MSQTLVISLHSHVKIPKMFYKKPCFKMCFICTANFSNKAGSLFMMMKYLKGIAALTVIVKAVRMDAC